MKYLWNNGKQVPVLESNKELNDIRDISILYERCSNLLDLEDKIYLNLDLKDKNIIIPFKGKVCSSKYYCKFTISLKDIIFYSSTIINELDDWLYAHARAHKFYKELRDKHNVNYNWLIRCS